MLVEAIELIKNIPDINKLNERTVETAIVFPLLRALQWNTSDPDEVICEYPAARHLTGFVDVALMMRESALVFIEVKAGGKSLDRTNRVQLLGQLLDYCRVASVDIGVLTNGRVWEFYHVKSIPVNISNPEPATRLDVIETDIDELTRMFTRLLARNSLFDDSALMNIQSAHEKNSLKKVWKELLLEGNNALAAVLRKELKRRTGISLKSAEVKEFISNLTDIKAKSKRSVQATKQEYVSQSQISTPHSEGAASGISKSKKPTYITVFGEKISVSTWKDVKINLIKAIIDKHPEIYGRLIELKSRRGKQYFARDETEASSLYSEPRQVVPGIWTESHASASALEKQCRAILEILGFSQSEFSIGID